MLVLHRAKLLASNCVVLALGVAPSGVRAAAPLSLFPRGRGLGIFGKDARVFIEYPKAYGAFTHRKPTHRNAWAQTVEKPT